MQLHKLVIFAMLLALLSIFAVPPLSFAHEQGSEQYTLEPLDGHSASMRDMAGPGLQFLSSKSKSSAKYIAGNDATAGPYWIIQVLRHGPLPQKAKGFNQANLARPLWLINQALLI